MTLTAFRSVLVRLSLTAALAALSLVTGCALPGGPPLPEISDEINATLATKVVFIKPGDTLEILFPYAPEWNQEILVGTDGRASFLQIDRLQVSGLLPAQLDEQLTDKYAGILSNPELTVIVKETTAPTVTVLGEVESPGTIEFPPDGRLTIVEALAQAALSPKGTAHLGSTVLVRWDARTETQRAWKIDLRPRYWDGDKTIFLQGHDLIYVPNKPIDDVGIWIDLYIRRLIPFPRIFTITS